MSSVKNNHVNYAMCKCARAKPVTSRSKAPVEQPPVFVSLTGCKYMPSPMNLSTLREVKNVAVDTTRDSRIEHLRMTAQMIILNALSLTGGVFMIADQIGDQGVGADSEALIRKATVANHNIQYARRNPNFNKVSNAKDVAAKVSVSDFRVRATFRMRLPDSSRVPRNLTAALILPRENSTSANANSTGTHMFGNLDQLPQIYHEWDRRIQELSMSSDMVARRVSQNLGKLLDSYTNYYGSFFDPLPGLDSSLNSTSAIGYRMMAVAATIVGREDEKYKLAANIRNPQFEIIGPATIGAGWLMTHGFAVDDELIHWCKFADSQTDAVRTVETKVKAVKAEQHNFGPSASAAAVQSNSQPMRSSSQEARLSSTNVPSGLSQQPWGQPAQPAPTAQTWGKAPQQQSWNQSASQAQNQSASQAQSQSASQPTVTRRFGSVTNVSERVKQQYTSNAASNSSQNFVRGGVQYTMSDAGSAGSATSMVSNGVMRRMYDAAKQK